MIIEPRRPERPMREIKFALPHSLYLRVRERKICHGELISDVVARALEHYFLRASRRDART